MKQINLLPWREQLREHQQRQFLQALGAALILAIIMILLGHWIYATKIKYQEYRNDRLKQEVVLLDEKTKIIQDLQKQKTQLLSRMTIIQDLQSERSLSVHLLDELVRIIPDGVFLTSIKQDGDNITLTGKAETNAPVSLLMRHIESSKWLSQPSLSEIKTNPNEKFYGNEFTLLMKSQGKS